jgi:hypothetical protein
VNTSVDEPLTLALLGLLSKLTCGAVHRDESPKMRVCLSSYIHPQSRELLLPRQGNLQGNIILH